MTSSNPLLPPLPPSPEQKSAAALNFSSHSASLDQFSLDESPRFQAAAATSNTIPISSHRLRSIARYRAFNPQALACSNILTSSFSDDDAVTTTPNKSPITSHNNDSAPSSLGAVAGPQGVALFRLSRPHVPLLILSHATNTTTAGSSISSLAFQPTTNSSGASGSGGANNSTAAPPSLYLAAARGSGILVWDASGHSSSPLMGRLSVDHSSNHMSNSLSAGTISTSASDARITSIAWKPSTVAPILAATTLSSLSLWDLRAAPVSTAFSTEIFKPSLRFGSVRKSGLESAVVVQVACASSTEECATIDSSGTVRVVSWRVPSCVCLVVSNLFSRLQYRICFVKKV
jgi:hypothetical protein